MSHAKTAEPIEMPFGLWTPVGSRHPVLGGGPDLLREGAISGRIRSVVGDYDGHGISSTLD